MFFGDSHSAICKNVIRPPLLAELSVNSLDLRVQSLKPLASLH